jgi:hypothetical protein
MGSITRGLSNNITTGGVILPAGITNASVSAVTSFANAANPANLVLISTQTASASATISFTTGLNSTYDEYVFKFINIHPSVNEASLGINFSTDGGSNYNVTKTTTFFQAYHFEDGSATALQYAASADLAQSTANQMIISGIDDDNDSSASGTLTLFNPSSTTYVKHFISLCNTVYPEVPNLCVQQHCAGYGNTTSAINAVRFQMSSGNIDDGIFKLYGVKKS